jgi:methionyl-tRNA formyltransferase
VQSSGLRIVTFNVFPMAYGLIAGWAERQGHEIILVVTSPGSHAERYGVAHLDLLAAVPPSQDVLVTTRLRRTAAPVIHALAPDLIMSATFPLRIPASLTAIPRYGALNLHPAPLPVGRGPNPQRLIYEGHPTIGATLHRLAPDFDAGHVLSRQQRPIPSGLTPELLLSTWGELLTAAMDEGVPRAVAGEEGEVQDDSLATYAAPFTDEERWLDWSESAERLQQRVAALNMPVPTARAILGNEPAIIAALRPLPSSDLLQAPGAVIERAGNVAVVQAGDGLVEVTVGDG